MSNISKELFEVAERLESIGAKGELSEIQIPLERLEEAANKIGKSWSGSWLGYYYRDLQPPPPRARFSQEWGLKDTRFIHETVGDWVEFDYDDVCRAIYSIAGNPNLEPVDELTKTACCVLENSREEVISLLTTILEERDDSFLARLKKEAENSKIVCFADFVKYIRPSGQFISRDMVALGQGLQTPPHLAAWANVMAMRQPIKECENLAKVAKRAASHLAKRERYARKNQEIGTNVFIGHGRSPL